MTSSMLCLGSKFGSTGSSLLEDRGKGSLPNASVDAAEIRRRAFEARLSSFLFFRSEREMPSMRSGITDSDAVVSEDVSETDVEIEAIDGSEQNSGADAIAAMVTLASLCPDVD